MHTIKKKEVMIEKEAKNDPLIVEDYHNLSYLKNENDPNDKINFHIDPRSIMLEDCIKYIVANYRNASTIVIQL